VTEPGDRERDVADGDTLELALVIAVVCVIAFAIGARRPEPPR
jgi:hypothetical protein